MSTTFIRPLGTVSLSRRRAGVNQVQTLFQMLTVVAFCFSAITITVTYYRCKAVTMRWHRASRARLHGPNSVSGACNGCITLNSDHNQYEHCRCDAGAMHWRRASRACRRSLRLGFRRTIARQCDHNRRRSNRQARLTEHWPADAHRSSCTAIGIGSTTSIPFQVRK